MKNAGPEAPIQLDAIDRRILATLQEEGRITNVELSQRAGISAPPYALRIAPPDDTAIPEGVAEFIKLFPNVKKIAIAGDAQEASGAAGMELNEPGFVAAVAEACRRCDVLLICDEVATGFGRTGTLFALEQCGVDADILCIGKGLTGGYLAMSATVASGRVYEAFLGEDLSERAVEHEDAADSELPYVVEEALPDLGGENELPPPPRSRRGAKKVSRATARSVEAGPRRRGPR